MSHPKKVQLGEERLGRDRRYPSPADPSVRTNMDPVGTPVREPSATAPLYYVVYAACILTRMSLLSSVQ